MIMDDSLVASPALPPSLSLEELRQALAPSFDVTAMLGRGGIGSVFRAWEPSMKRHVAVKVIAVAKDYDEARAGLTLPENFRREAEALSRLTHPHIVSLYQFGKTDCGIHFLVMEYVPGTCLHRVLQNEPVTSTRFFGWVFQVCSALQHAHSMGIVHRDVKPSNILINTVGAAKLIDFGLAKHMGVEAFDSHWRYQSVGTPDYAAPEALEDGAMADHRADIYSVGVIIYEVLCGKRPQYPYIPPSLRRPDLDPRFDQLLARALQQDREHRYQQMDNLKADLREILKSLT
jgi:serine/threonine protein kinase